MLFKTHREATPEATVSPEPNEGGETLTVRSVLTDKRGISTSISESLGAIGLGVLVMVGIAVGIGAAYNYGQDSSAKSTLDAVKAAEILHQAKNDSFGGLEALTTGQDPALTKTSPDLMIAANEKNYCAAIESGSMYSPSYWVTAKSGELLDEMPTTEQAGIACPDPEAG